jgi:hypothetical protein
VTSDYCGTFATNEQQDAFDKYYKLPILTEWPFKPFVEGSNPPALTKKSSSFGGFFCFVERHPLEG